MRHFNQFIRRITLRFRCALTAGGCTMIKIFSKSLFFTFFLMICCDVLSSTEIKVTAQGKTELSAIFDNSRILATFWTRTIDIGAQSDVYPERKFTNCTYSRNPCSSVELIEIKFNDEDLFVSRSIFADLADINTASVKKKGKDQFILTLNGGDASESYTVDITFNKISVKERETKINIDGVDTVMQKSIYSAPKYL